MNIFLQPAIIAAILIAAIVFIFIKTKTGQISERFLDKKDKLIILALMGCYGVFSFVNLGQTNTYGSWNGDYQGKYFDVNFKTPTQISNIYYYMGMGKGNLAISYKGVNNTQGNLILANDYYRGDYAWYKWLNVTLPENAGITQLHVYVNAPDSIELKQLALFDKNHQLVTDFTLSSQSDLEHADLQSLFSPTPPKNLHNFLSGMFLDEVFYGQTAYQYLHGITPYAWAHPQLALLIIALGVWLFGMSPFGWRFFPNISGIALIGVVYVFAKRVFEDRRAAILASLLIMFDFMHFTFTRTASIDSIKTLFIAFEYYFLYDYFIKRKQFSDPLIAWRSLLWCGIFFGLAISTKWDALFSVFAILPTLVYAELIINKPDKQYSLAKVIGWQAIIMIIIPITIYCLCYVPFYLIANKNGDAYASGSLIDFIIKYQQQMLEFHTKGKEGITHPFLSPWWSWPLNMKPDTVWSHQEQGSLLSSSIIMMGNPVFWWALFPALIFAIKQIISHKDPKVIFLVGALLSLWLPWALMGHYTFIYYFYSVTPLLALLVTNMLYSAIKHEAKFGVYFYMAIVIGLFIAFYPGISGMEFDRAYVTGHLSWFSTWRY